MTADDDLKQLVKERRYVTAFKALQNRKTDRPYPRGSFDELWDDIGRLRQAGTPFAAVVAIFGVLLLIVAVIVVALTAGGLRVAEWTLFPAVDRLFTFVVSNVFRPGVLPALAFTVLVLGLPFSYRFRSPSLFATGVIFTSLGLICFWLFPVFIGVVQRQCPPEAELPLVIVGGVMSLLAFVVGYSSWGRRTGNPVYDDVVAARSYLKAGSGALLRLKSRPQSPKQTTRPLNRWIPGPAVGTTRVASWQRCGNARASR